MRRRVFFFFFNVNFFVQMYLVLYMAQHNIKHLQSSDFPSEVDYNLKMGSLTCIMCIGKYKE